jgi:hypothetical protein
LSRVDTLELVYAPRASAAQPATGTHATPFTPTGIDTSQYMHTDWLTQVCQHERTHALVQSHSIYINCSLRYLHILKCSLRTHFLRTGLQYHSVHVCICVHL